MDFTPKARPDKWEAVLSYGVLNRLSALRIARVVAPIIHRPLWEGYNAFYGRAGATALPDAVTQATWGRFFDIYEPTHALVAEEGKTLLGLAHYLFHRSTIIVEASCYLHDLFTAEAARGKGVGRALIEAVFERARNAGLNRVYWHTDEINQRSMALYDKLADKPGFVMYRKALSVA